MYRVWALTAMTAVDDEVDTRFSVELYEAPMFIANLDRLLDTALFSFDWLTWVKFPEVRVVRDEGEWYTLKEWYGNLGEFLRLHIADKLAQFCWKRFQHRMTIRITNEEARVLSSSFVDDVLATARMIQEEEDDEVD